MGLKCPGPCLVVSNGPGNCLASISSVTELDLKVNHPLLHFLQLVSRIVFKERPSVAPSLFL